MFVVSRFPVYRVRPRREATVLDELLTDQFTGVVGWYPSVVRKLVMREIARFCRSWAAGTPRDKDVELERLRGENADFRRRNEERSRGNDELVGRVAKLERLVRELGGAARTERLEQAYSMKAEEQRQAEQAGVKKRRKQKSSRRGRVTTQDKLDRAEVVLPSTAAGSSS